MEDRDHALPHWDLTVVYPAIESQAFESAYADLADGIGDLEAMFDQWRISRQDERVGGEDAIAGLEQIVPRLDQVAEQARTIYAYLFAHIATDSRDERAQAKWSEFQQLRVRLSLIDTRLTAWIGSLDVDELVSASSVAEAHEHMLRRSSQQAMYQLPPDQEELIAELDLVAGKAWAKLHGTYTSQLSVAVELEGEVQELPMSAVRNLASSPDREVRQRAYDAELAAWEWAAVPVAAAMNGIKGQVQLLAQRRGWDSALDESLFASNIERTVLDAMMGAARDSFPDFRRYLRAKARALGLSTLTWYDLFAPLGAQEGRWRFEEAASLIVEQFGTYSEKLADLASRAFRERWIDAEPRAGKRDGAFCMWIQGDASRILANYRPVYPGMSTLAHELGHAYHNLNLAGRTMLQRDTPMTMAETSSIFCETIVREAVLADATAEQQLAILEAALQGACQVVVDISSRFLFEQRAFEGREARELSASEFCELMGQAQLETYGEGLDANTLHPYMWAAKPHYYSATRSYYNYPYMFGLLFGLGLYARYKEDPAAFRVLYDELLSLTGMMSPADLAARFGIDLGSQGFWQSSLDLIRADIDRFERLVNEPSS
jgi:pepF/M3 family oligoendopeptidase